MIKKYYAYETLTYLVHRVQSSPHEVLPLRTQQENGRWQNRDAEPCSFPKRVLPSEELSDHGAKKQITTQDIYYNVMNITMK